MCTINGSYNSLETLHAELHRPNGKLSAMLPTALEPPGITTRVERISPRKDTVQQTCVIFAHLTSVTMTDAQTKQDRLLLRLIIKW
jgi:hypothetical protein